MSPRISHQAAARQLADRIPQIAALAAAAGPIRLRPPQDSHFAALVRAITYQQLAGAAAAAIHGRLVLALDGTVEPAAVVAISDDALRAAGLSANKAASLRDLAAKVLDGTVVLEPRGIARESDARGHRPPDHGAGHRGVDGADVPDVPAAPPRRVADR